MRWPPSVVSMLPVGQGLFVVLAEDQSRARFQAPLAGHCLRQLRQRGRSRPAGEAPRPGGFHPRCLTRRALPALQQAWQTAHHCLGAASFDLKREAVNVQHVENRQR